MKYYYFLTMVILLFLKKNKTIPFMVIFYFNYIELTDTLFMTSIIESNNVLIRVIF